MILHVDFLHQIHQNQ